MAAAKRLLRRPAVSAAAGWLAAKYLLMVKASSRFRIENGETVTDCIDSGRPFIICFWHGRMLSIPVADMCDAPVNALVSFHRDGLFLSGVLRRLGINTISGSSSRGGANALKGAIRALRRGEPVAITPDGPRGPRMRASPGAVLAAKLSGAALLPVSGGLTRRRVFRSWDRFMLPHPFTRALVRFGPPMEVPATADERELDEARRQLERELNRLSREIDAELGVETVDPAEEAAPA